ncbi:MAG: sigma-70 family RNA polymerase sigma factor [Verrucomicrobiota bacterium]
MDDDRELLRQFAGEGSQTAFAGLVRDKAGLVYAAALRQTGGDAHLAQDVTQAVFLALAANAGRLQRHAVLAGWLFTTTRFLAAKAVRAQHRWQQREREANAMKLERNEGEPGWENLRPVIDEALHELAAKDRDVLLLRFFEGRSFSEVGGLTGLAENAARMRVERALDKLRARLAQRGVTSTAAALGVLLANQPAVAVPASLVASAAGAGLAAATVGGGILAVGTLPLVFMSAAKITAAAAALVALGALGGYFGAVYQDRTRVRELRAATVLDAHESKSSPPATTAIPAPPAGKMTVAGAVRTGTGTANSLESLRVLLDLQRRKLATPGVQLVEDGAKITDEFVELFALTPAEQETLRQSLGGARARLASLEREHTTVGRQPNGDAMIEIRAYPEQGGAVYDAMMRTFAETLGPERYTAFLALGAEQTEKALGRFGTAQSLVTVSREVLPDGEVRYRIRQRAQSTPEDNSNYLSDRLTPERFVHEAGSWLELLPADFAPRR